MGYNRKLNRYVHPETHPASMIVTDTNHRFVTDAQIDQFLQDRRGEMHEASNEDEAICASLSNPANIYCVVEGNMRVALIITIFYKN